MKMRRMKVKWTQKIRKKRNSMNTLRIRIGRFIGHILRHSSLLKTVLEAEISVKNYSGRPRMEYIAQIMKDVKIKSCVGMKRLAENREDW
jgi:hypothetical protein